MTDNTLPTEEHVINRGRFIERDHETIVYTMHYSQPDWTGRDPQFWCDFTLEIGGEGTDESPPIQTWLIHVYIFSFASNRYEPVVDPGERGTEGTFNRAVSAAGATIAYYFRNAKEEAKLTRLRQARKICLKEAQNYLMELNKSIAIDLDTTVTP